MGWKRWGIGLAASVLVAAGGRRSKALDDHGAIAATAVGTAVIGGSSWRGAVILGSFFVSGSALSKINRRHDPVGKSGERDAWQVIANGGVAAVASLLPSSRFGTTTFSALAGSLAAATADTWATEIGSTSPTPPRLLVSRELVDPGLSGGVTVRGTLAALAGAAGIGGLVLIFSDAQSRLRQAVAVAIAGFAGCLLDSLLGEFAQERRWSPASQRWVERPVDGGQPTLRVGGVPGVTNDVVNLLATTFGALAAVGLERLITSVAGRRAGSLASR